MKDLSLLIPIAMRPWLLAAFLVLFLTVGSAMKRITASMQPPPLSLQITWTQAGADKILAQWDAADKSTARKNLMLDFLFIVSYVGALVVAGAMASDALGTAPWARGAITMAVLATGLFDVGENLGQLAMLSGQRGHVWPLLTSVYACVKFFLFGSAVLYVLCGLAAFLWHHFRHQP